MAAAPAPCYPPLRTRRIVGRDFARRPIRCSCKSCFRRYQPSAAVGETLLVGLAPAIGNAIFTCMGIRLRSLPMLPEGKLPEDDSPT
jgi:hypothetical protein